MKIGATSLLLLIVVFLSCNQHRKMQTYSYNNSSISDNLVLKSKDSLKVEFELTHADKNKPVENYTIRGIAKNIDPDGETAFEELDPSGKDNPTELYFWKQNDKKLLIIIPIVNVDYVGIEYENRNKEKYIVTLKE